MRVKKRGSKRKLEGDLISRRGRKRETIDSDTSFGNEVKIGKERGKKPRKSPSGRQMGGTRKVRFRIQQLRITEGAQGAYIEETYGDRYGKLGGCSWKKTGKHFDGEVSIPRSRDEGVGRKRGGVKNRL